MSAPTKKALGAGVLGGSAIIAAAMALVLPDLKMHEGKRNDPYRDVVGVLTVCYGDTQVAMRRYSDAECSAMLNRRVEADYAAPILRCVPGFKDRAYPFAASISLSYNIGTSAFCRSSAARMFNERKWAAGCDAMLLWNKAGGRVVRGLVNRREAERKLCMKGAA